MNQVSNFRHESGPHSPAVGPQLFIEELPFSRTLVLLACIEVAATGVLKIWTGIADEQQLRHRLPFGGQHWQHKWWVVTPLILVLLLCGGLLIAERPDLVGQSIVVTPFIYTLF